jgi:hypothetical protein
MRHRERRMDWRSKPLNKIRRSRGYDKWIFRRRAIGSEDTWEGTITDIRERRGRQHDFFNFFFSFFFSFDSQIMPTPPGGSLQSEQGSFSKSVLRCIGVVHQNTSPPVHHAHYWRVRDKGWHAGNQCFRGLMPG